ncbi:hypothetical protein IWQ61_005384 [Dispira simplex]|nr:hypothetical protein IWQ61_005384 [Dispira simplex]
MSSDLLWLAVKDFNSFQTKRNGFTFTREHGNPSLINSPVTSGLSNVQTLDVKAVGSGPAIRLTKTERDGRKLAGTRKSVIIKNTRAIRTAADLEKAVGSSLHPRVANAALKRLHATRKGQRTFTKKAAAAATEAMETSA